MVGCSDHKLLMAAKQEGFKKTVNLINARTVSYPIQ